MPPFGEEAKFSASVHLGTQNPSLSLAVINNFTKNYELDDKSNELNECKILMWQSSNIHALHSPCLIFYKAYSIPDHSQPLPPPPPSSPYITLDKEMRSNETNLWSAFYHFPKSVQSASTALYNIFVRFLACVVYKETNKRFICNPTIFNAVPFNNGSNGKVLLIFIMRTYLACSRNLALLKRKLRDEPNQCICKKKNWSQQERAINMGFLRWHLGFLFGMPGVNICARKNWQL